MAPVKIQENNLLHRNTSHARKRVKLSAEDLKSVECEDTIHFCPDTYSCCVKRDDKDGKSYGCCPVENAVCCDDGINW